MRMSRFHWFLTCIGNKEDRLATFFENYYQLFQNGMEEIIKAEGVNYSVFSDQSKKTVASAASAVSSIKAVLDTPILTDSGVLTKESETLLIDLGNS